jgi:flagellar basal-body rod modification protein FlgD
MIESIAPTAPSASAGTSSSYPAQSSGSTAQAGMNGLLDPNEFLSLLVDNLKYQDPLDPTSSADLLTQLASLSQVQTQQQIAETDQTSAAANLIGDTVTGSDSTGKPVTGVVSGFSITSSGPTLDVGGKSLSLGSVSSVDGSSTPATGSAGSSTAAPGSVA